MSQVTVRPRSDQPGEWVNLWIGVWGGHKGTEDVEGRSSGPWTTWQEHRCLPAQSWSVLAWGGRTLPVVLHTLDKSLP